MARRGGGDAGGSDSPGHLQNCPGEAVLRLCLPRRADGRTAPKRRRRLPRWSGSRSGGSHSRSRGARMAAAPVRQSRMPGVGDWRLSAHEVFDSKWFGGMPLRRETARYPTCLHRKPVRRNLTSFYLLTAIYVIYYGIR